MRTTKKQIDRLMRQLADHSNGATSVREAKEKGLDNYLFAEYALVYGGYRLVRVNITKFNHSEAFGLSTVAPRQKANQFYTSLSFLIAGLTTKN